MKDKKFRYYLTKLYSVYLMFILLFIIGALLVRFTEIDPITAYLAIGIHLTIYIFLSIYLYYRGVSKYSWQGPFYDGEKAFEKGNFDDAIALFHKALKLNDEKPKIWYNLGLTLQELKKYEDALFCYEKALKINDARKDSLRKGLMDRAIKIQLSYVYRALGNYQKALETIMERLEWTTQDDRIYRDIALFSNDLGKYEEAIDAAEKALETNMNGGIAYTHQGFAYMKLGNLEKARILLEKAIEIDPNFARSYYNLALYFFELNKPKKALEYCEKSLQVDENFEECKDFKEKIANIVMVRQE